MKTPLVSFVIPVYNAEKYLEECLESILTQTIEDWEAILVDNGSHDRSGTICDVYAQKSEKVKVFHLEKNQGPGAARNIGLTKAGGQYIHFIDSDDYIARNLVENIAKALQIADVDVLHIQYECVASNDKRNMKNEVVITTDEDIRIIDDNESICQLFLEQPNLQIGIWQFVIKREFLLQHDITFPQTRYGEDVLFYLKLVLEAQSFIAILKKHYFYRTNVAGSVTQKVSKEPKTVFLDLIGIAANMIDCPSYTKNGKILQARFIKHYLRDAFRLLFCLQEDKEVLSSIEALLKTHEAYFKQHSQEIALYTFIQEYGIHDGIAKKLQSLNEALERVTDCYHKPYIFVMPASKPNVAIAEWLKHQGAQVSGYLDNNPEIAQKILSDSVVYSPEFLKRIRPKEDMAIIISSSRDEVEQALVKQMQEDYLLEEEQIFCLK